MTKKKRRRRSLITREDYETAAEQAGPQFAIFFAKPDRRGEGEVERARGFSSRRAQRRFSSLARTVCGERRFNVFSFSFLPRDERP